MNNSSKLILEWQNSFRHVLHNEFKHARLRDVPKEHKGVFFKRVREHYNQRKKVT